MMLSTSRTSLPLSQQNEVQELDATSEATMTSLWSHSTLDAI
jgi:hypothetical protein